MSFIFAGLSKASNETLELVNAENGVLEHSVSPFDHEIFFIDSSSGHTWVLLARLRIAPSSPLPSLWEE